MKISGRRHAARVRAMPFILGSTGPRWTRPNAVILLRKSERRLFLRVRAPNRIVTFEVKPNAFHGTRFRRRFRLREATGCSHGWSAAQPVEGSSFLLAPAGRRDSDARGQFRFDGRYGFD